MQYKTVKNWFEQSWVGGTEYFGDYVKSRPVRRGGGAQGQTKTEKDVPVAFKWAKEWGIKQNV